MVTITIRNVVIVKPTYITIIFKTQIMRYL